MKFIKNKTARYRPLFRQIIWASCLLFLFSPQRTFAQASASTEDVSYLWRVINGSNLPKNSKKFLEYLAIYNKSGAKIMTQAMIEDNESTLVASHVRTMFTPLAGREKSFTETAGDFVLGAMLSTLKNRSVDQMLTGDFSYQVYRGDRLDLELNFQTTDSSLKERLKSEKTQDYISDPNYRVGLITTQQYGESIFSGGTNRRPIKKLVEDFLCKPVESLMNFTISDRWVGRDIPRSPGNDSKVYLNRCMGCHTGLDSLRGAFAGYNFNSELTWSRRVENKLNNNPNTSPEGFIVTNDTWEHLGWLPVAPDQVSTSSSRKYHSGPKDLIQMVVNSRQYYSCLTQQVKDRLCRETKVKSQTMDEVVTSFQKHKQLKTAFAEVASQVCLNSTPSIDGVSNRYQLVRQLEIATGLSAQKLNLEETMLAKLPKSGSVEEINGTFLRTWAQLSFSACKKSADAGDLASSIKDLTQKKLTLENFIKSFYEKNLGESVLSNELKVLMMSTVAPKPYDSVVTACALILASPKLYLIQKH